MPDQGSPARGLSASVAPPGDPGLWILITADIFLFAVFFNVFIWQRFRQLALFEQSRHQLDANLGLLDTFFLLTSSWFMVGAVHAARAKDRARVSRFLTFAIIAGAGFAVSKILEYTQKLQHGITMQTNDFFQYYFIFTGFHFFHVLIGMGVLVVLWVKSRHDALDRSYLLWIESGASYWHMVDLLWLILFPLLYLLRE